MKRTLAFLLALMLTACFGAGAALSEDGGGMFVTEDEPATAGEAPIEVLPELPTELVVGNATKLSGNFFTDLWGNNTSDMDVRALIHGYNTVVWTSQTTFDADPTVVSDVRFVTHANGDKEYYIILNDTLTYNDGAPITAADYVFTVLLMASPEVAELGGSSGAYKYVAGYDAYHSGASERFSGVRLINNHMFSLRISAEYLPFFYESSYYSVTPYPIQAIAPGCVVEDNAGGAAIITDVDNIEIDPDTGEGVNADLFTAELLMRTLFDETHGYASHPTLTSGPYTLTYYDKDAGTAIFERNEYYLGNWEGVIPTIERITLKHAEPGTMIERLVSGEFTLLNKCTSVDVIEAGIEAEFDYETYARRGYGFLSFACERGAQNSVLVRQAIAYALDTQAYLESLLGDYGLQVYGYYGIGQWMLQASTGAITLPDLTAEEQEEWDSVTLDELNTYEYNLETAAALLDKDGWTLDADGGEYVDGVRHKNVNGEIVPLTLKWAKTINNNGANALAEILLPALDALGVSVEVTELPFTEMLEYYYRQRERTYDMFYMATNFNPVFDPSGAFSTHESMQGVVNTTGIADETLEKLALDMSRTASEDVIEYYLRWFELQKRFNEILPTIPLYSNVYADFFVPTLQDYSPFERSGWAEAVLYAYFGYDEPDDMLLDGDDDGGDDDVFTD